MFYTVDMDKAVKEIAEEQAEETPKKKTPAPPAQQQASNIAVPQDFGPNLERLWEYKCPLTKGRNVSCIAWNKENPVSACLVTGQ